MVEDRRFNILIEVESWEDAVPILLGEPEDARLGLTTRANQEGFFGTLVARPGRKSRVRDTAGLRPSGDGVDGPSRGMVRLDQSPQCTVRMDQSSLRLSPARAVGSRGGSVASLAGGLRDFPPSCSGGIRVFPHSCSSGALRGEECPSFFPPPAQDFPYLATAATVPGVKLAGKASLLGAGSGEMLTSLPVVEGLRPLSLGPAASPLVTVGGPTSAPLSS